MTSRLTFWKKQIKLFRGCENLMNPFLMQVRKKGETLMKTNELPSVNSKFNKKNTLPKK